MAQEAYCIGPAPTIESYLQGDKIIDVALESGADAIHPGYGFLAENAAFAKAVIAAGLTWIGPPPEAIEIMGDKLTARATMAKAGVPLVPGTDMTDNMGDEKLVAAANDIGFPVLVKAAAGGGGKGMRVVQKPEDLPEAIRVARR
jgi:acetyl/propionyl-CoA carboxylase alpha subunit